CVSVVAEVGALVDETFAVAVDHQAERIAVAIAGAVLAVHVAVVGGVALPGHCMRTGPLAVGLRPDIDRHADAVAGVVAGAPNLRHVPARAEVAGAPLTTRFEAATRQHDRRHAEQLLRAVDENADAFDAV